MNNLVANEVWRAIAFLAIFLLSLFAGHGAFGAEPNVAVTVAQIGEGFVVDILAEAPVSQAVAWEVLTDFDHMAAFLGNLKSSRVTRREGLTVRVRQEGIAHYGPLSFAFESEREIRLEPKRRILAKSLSGTARRMESEALIRPLNEGVEVRYHAEVVPDSAVARMFGATVVRHEIEEQFRELFDEMLKRQARLVKSAGG